jgi:Protein of unknown function (DUF3617)
MNAPSEHGPEPRMLVAACVACVALLSAAASWADELPARRAGFWKHATSTGDGAPMNSEFCVDAATDKKLQKRSTAIADSPSCPASEFRQERGMYVHEATCKQQDTVMNYRTEVKGDFSSKITSTTTITQTPATKDSAPTRMVTTAVWSGACPAGWKPGEFSMNGSERMDIDGLMDIAEGLTKGLGKLFGR